MTSNAINEKPNRLRRSIDEYLRVNSPQNRMAVLSAAGLQGKVSVSNILDEDYQQRTGDASSGIIQERSAGEIGTLVGSIAPEEVSFDRAIFLNEFSAGARPTVPSGKYINWGFDVYRFNSSEYTYSSFQSLSLFFESGIEPTLVPDICGQNYELFYYYGGKRAWSEPENVSHDIGLIHDRFSGANYCHWLIDKLPRVILLQEFGFPDTAKLVLPYAPPPYVVQSLERIGIPNDRIISLTEKTSFSKSSVRAPRAWGMTSSGPHFRHALHRGSKWAFNRIRKEFYRRSDKKRSILLQRRGPRHLRLNKKTLTLLEKYNFETIFAEDYSFGEQIELFSGAERVIAPHGAGLANIVFCQEGAKILEYVPPYSSPPAFWIVAHAAGLEYSRAVGEVGEGDLEHNKRPQHLRGPSRSDIIVSYDVIEKWLDDSVYS